ncbi:uncharacterized protein LOC121798537 [Salvia splendens]|uniref:uncharacterized protein LOC121798537 n=1 Tax=Salvia splendens TaxID=180675 RepID=UPI001C26D75A|nr:uncharacterized protein LOC121798537 [Salvia splendens]
MQILQWLLKIPEQEPPKIASNSTKKECDHEEKKVMPKELVILVSKRRKHVPKSKVSCENLILLRFFHQTLNLKGLGAFKGYQNPLQKKPKTSKKKTSENKVLPLGEPWSRTDSSSNHVAGSDKTKKKKKAVSRMKELLKWATTAKVLNSKKEGVIGSKQVGAVKDDVEESPKISFIIDMEDAAEAGIGNWITSDSEFVVLEL